MIDLLIFVAILVNFNQWKSCMDFFIDKKFVNPLRVGRASDKEIFESRVYSLAKTIKRQCKDDHTALQLIEEADYISKTVFEDKKPLQKEVEETFTNNVF